MKRFFSIIGSLLNTLITGGQFGSHVPGESKYEKRQKQRRRDMEKYGTHSCQGGCGTLIPKNNKYCYPCYLKYKKS